MKTAQFDKGLKSLHFFNTRNTALNVRCATITDAKKILKKDGVAHDRIEVYSMGRYLKTVFL